MRPGRPGVTADALAAFIYDSPAWLVICGFVAVGLIYSWLCQAAVRRLMTAHMRGQNGELVNFTVTTIAVLYAVLLAFMTVATWENFSKASDNSGVEANLFANLYHDALGLPLPLAADLRRHILDYLNSVIDKEWPMQARGEQPEPQQPALNNLHRHVALLSPLDPGDAVVMGDMLRVLNQLDSSRAARLGTLGGRVPSLIWGVIIGMGFLTVGYATLFVAESAFLQTLMQGGLVLAIALVVLMIVELDNPFRGTISVSSQPYRDVLHLIQQPMPDADAD